MEPRTLTDNAALLVLITRVPQAGKAKTRLIPALGAQGAADMQRALSSHVARMMHHAAVIAGQRDFDGHAPLIVDRLARVVGGSLDEARSWLGMECREQGAGDLGARMARAMSEGFDAGYGVVAVLGGDCAELNGVRVREALVVAAENGAALIPARDGGFCLFALRRNAVGSVNALFAEREWSTAQVCEQHVARLRKQGLEPALLEACGDIDDPADLALWTEIQRQWNKPPQSLAVIIPTCNEEANLASCVEAARAYLGIRAPYLAVEFVVADGGSRDSTVAVARQLGCRVIKADRGRAAQMNAGAAATESDALLFLHADTRLMAATSQAQAPTFLETLANAHLALGAFTFAFDRAACSLREKIACAIYERNTRARVAHYHDPYGDQALFCRRAFFESLGGFGAAPFMEDVLLGERAQRTGAVVIVGDKALTSPRRYRMYGFLKTMLANRRAVRGLHRGQPLDALAQAYRAQFKKSGN